VISRERFDWCVESSSGHAADTLVFSALTPHPRVSQGEGLRGKVFSEEDAENAELAQSYSNN
jgi:hypothetical protein